MVIAYILDHFSRRSLADQRVCQTLLRQAGSIPEFPDASIQIAGPKNDLPGQQQYWNILGIIWRQSLEMIWAKKLVARYFMVTFPWLCFICRQNQPECAGCLSHLEFETYV